MRLPEDTFHKGQRMPLETATYIPQLTTTNPVHTDGLSQADSHLRLLKSVLQAQFPAFTAAPLASSNTAIDAAVAAVSTNGVAILADAGAFFKTNTTDGFTNPSSTEIDVKLAGVVVAQFLNTGLVLPGNLTVTGNVAVTGASSGPGHVPIGATVVWWTDTLPAGSGTWAWCNGQQISTTTFATLFGLLGSTYGAGSGTFGLPDLRDNVPVGKGTMGATSAAGRITNFVTSTLGNLFGECLHLLGIGEIPAHTPSGTISGTQSITAAPSFADDSAYTGGVQPRPLNHGVATNVNGSSFTFTGNSVGGGGSHNNVQPTIVCNWIMRIA